MDRWVNSLGRTLLGGSGLKKSRAAGTGFAKSSFYTEELYSEPLSHREACTQGGLYTQKLLHRDFFTHGSYTHRSFYTKTFLHGVAFTYRSLCTEKS